MDDGGNSTINLGLWELFNILHELLNGTGYNNDVGNPPLINFMDDKLRQLEERVNRLEQLLEKAKVFEPYVPEDLAQGEDSLSISYTVHEDDGHYINYSRVISSGDLVTTWNELFASIAPYLIVECSRTKVIRSIEKLILKKNKTSTNYVRVCRDMEGVIIAQFMALNLITPSTKKHSITDDIEYWCLTDFGKQLMLKLSPIKREN